MKNKRNEGGESPKGKLIEMPVRNTENNHSPASEGQHKLITLSFDAKLLSEMIVQLFPSQYA